MTVQGAPQLLLLALFASGGLSSSSTLRGRDWHLRDKRQHHAGLEHQSADAANVTWAAASPNRAAPRQSPLREIQKPIVVSVRSAGSDGTEIGGAEWLEHGFHGGVNRIGHSNGVSYDLGLRFEIPQLAPGQEIVFARLVLPATDQGIVESPLALRIVGVAASDVEPYWALRPAAYPRIHTAVPWTIEKNWPGRSAKDSARCMPLRRYTPDVSSIINEITSLPGWGTGPNGRTIGLIIDDIFPGEGDKFVAVVDSSGSAKHCRNDHSVKLQLFPTVRSTFLGKELLGRPSDRSVTVNAYSLIPMEIYFVYGPKSEHYTLETEPTTHAASEEIEVVLDGLQPNSRYVYRMMFRRPGEDAFEAGPEGTFHTQRTRGIAFTFVLQSDSHLQGVLRGANWRAARLYRASLRNGLADQPDFMIDLGDTFHTQYFAGRDAYDYLESFHRHLDHRRFFDLIGHSVPVFLVLGNHEGEQGWRLHGSPDNLAVWATRARKLLYPNAYADDFYSGIDDTHPAVGRREAIYAFEWGDALFVVLDPYWHTRENPHPRKQAAGVPDAWRWTLGYEQYAWFRGILENSDARFKMVFAHQLTGSVNARVPYGRGGIRAASYAVDGRGSFEWGGEEADGTYGFDVHRPGWGRPVHRLMVDNDVAVFFHGHDHCFATEKLDHIVYQEVGSPNDTTRGVGHCIKGRVYDPASVIRNPGIVRVTVTPEQVIIETIRSDASDASRNGRTIHSVSIWDCNLNGRVDSKEIARRPALDADGDGRLDNCTQDLPGRGLVAQLIETKKPQRIIAARWWQSYGGGVPGRRLEPAH
ncbi:MAG: FN3 domain-containing metallophosphoesterase family protein [Myxococcota bacterium]